MLWLNLEQAYVFASHILDEFKASHC